MDKDKFKKLYDKCFDEDGNVKACGRQSCKNLIQFLGDRKYGDEETGLMNPSEINKLYKELFR